jgi:hypothetical protein
VAEFLQLVKDALAAPQVQIWLAIGLIAGAIYGHSRFRRPDTLLLITAMVVGPPLLYLALFSSVGMNPITLILMLIFGMLGFVGFALGWLPGLLLGCVLGFLIDRNRTDRPSIPKE